MYIQQTCTSDTSTRAEWEKEKNTEHETNSGETKRERRERKEMEKLTQNTRIDALKLNKTGDDIDKPWICTISTSL